MAPDGQRTSDQQLLRWASWILQAQGVALSLLCLGFGAYALGHHPLHHNLAEAEFEFAIGLLAGVVLVFGGRGLARRLRAAYSPLLLLELICLPVAWGLSQGHLWVYSALVGVPALVVVIVLFSPAGRRVLSGEE
jgi:hypothetical protein